MLWNMKHLPVLSFLLCLFLAPALRSEEAPEPSYVYWAEFVRIVDGDTIAMDLDLGFGVWIRNQSLGLLDAGSAGQDAETRAKDKARLDKLRELCKDGTDFVVRTTRDRNAQTPRYYAEIWVDGESLNEAMRQAFP